MVGIETSASNHEALADATSSARITKTKVFDRQR